MRSAPFGSHISRVSSSWAGHQSNAKVTMESNNTCSEWEDNFQEDSNVNVLEPVPFQVFDKKAICAQYALKARITTTFSHDS